MREQFRRTQVWITIEERRAIAEIARREGRSMSAVIREMIRSELERPELADGKKLKNKRREQDFNLLLAAPDSSAMSEDEARELAVQAVRDVRASRRAKQSA